MENYNRLFLLEEPGVPTGLTQNILSGVDVTPEKEYSGKVTLTQLNAYSGELKAEALTNFQTIKIGKDGSETYTNVAKLLIELQQGGGADDAREEADINIASVEGDMEIKRDLAQLSAEVRGYHDVYSPVALDGYELASASDEENKRWTESQETDGVRTRFVAEDGISFGRNIHVVLNGVIVTPEDGNIIMSSAHPYAMGFEFNVAPSVGDIVEFFVGTTLGKAAGPYEKAKAANEAAETAAIEAFAAWELERKAENDAFDAELAKANEKKTTIQADLAEAKADVEKAREEYANAESVDGINKAAKSLVAAIQFEADLSRALTEVEGQIAILSAKLDAIKKSVKSESDERAQAAAEFNAKQDEMNQAIAKFAEIADEHAAIENPPLA